MTPQTHAAPAPQARHCDAWKAATAEEQAKLASRGGLEIDYDSGLGNLLGGDDVKEDDGGQ
jgi:hypothetical protein